MQQQTNPDVPSRFIYELTQLCNYRCSHCFVEHRLAGPNTADAIFIADKVTAAGVPSISWTGGEPYVRKDLWDIMESIAPSNTIHTINTNGTTIDKDIARRTARHFALARVSVFGDPETYKVNACSGKFGYETPMTAIRQFLDAGIPVQVNIPAIDLELARVDHVVRDVDKRFGSALEEIVLIPTITVGSRTPVQGMDLKAVERYAQETTTKSKLRYFIWKPGKHMVMMADTDVYAHPIERCGTGSIYIGNIFREEIKALWARFPEEFKQAHRELTPDISHLKAGV